MHQRSDIDVTSNQFLIRLAGIGQAFANQRLHELLELNVAGHLFPSGTMLTQEVTDETARVQRVTLIEPPVQVMEDD